MKTKQLDPTKLTDPSGHERRFVSVSDLEIRADDDKTTFEGHAAVFDSPTDIGGWFRETVARGAFKKTIQEADVRMLLNHNPDFVLARNKAGTLTLSEDSVGLLSVAELDRRQSYSNDLAISMERGDITQMSFGFQVIEDAWEKDGEEVPSYTFGATRTLQQVRLFDVSPVTYPAYTDTDASLRTAGFHALFHNLSDEQRAELLQAVISGQVTKDSAPVLEAASEALREAARSVEPVEDHSNEAEKARLELQHRFNARKHGLAA